MFESASKHLTGLEYHIKIVQGSPEGEVDSMSDGNLHIMKSTGWIENLYEVNRIDWKTS